jgi:hypothetical protein
MKDCFFQQHFDWYNPESGMRWPVFGMFSPLSKQIL